MKKIFFFTFISFLFVSSSIKAQYVENKNYLGPSIGFAWHGSTGEFGVNYEHSIDKNFSIGGILRFYSYNETVWSNKWSYSYIFIGAQGNYHLLLDDRKLDPFFGLVLGFSSYSLNVPAGVSASGSSGLFLGAHASFRYWLNPNIGVMARLNFGNLDYGGLDIGVDFKF